MTKRKADVNVIVKSKISTRGHDPGATLTELKV